MKLGYQTTLITDMQFYELLGFPAPWERWCSSSLCGLVWSQKEIKMVSTVIPAVCVQHAVLLPCRFLEFLAWLQLRLFPPLEPEPNCCWFCWRGVKCICHTGSRDFLGLFCPLWIP